MEYISVKDAAHKWGITERAVQIYCKNMKLPGAKRIGMQWLIPSDAELPLDGRTKSAKKQPAMAPYHFPLFMHSPYYSLQSELNGDENLLYDAELMYLKCSYADCIVKCRQIQATSPARHVLFGSFCVIGYASLVLGLYTEYESAVKCMKQMIADEQLHKDDYRLLLNGLIMHVTKDPDLLYEVDPLKLGSEAICYYQQLMITIRVFTLHTEDEHILKFYLSYLRRLELEAITPSLVNVNCMLSVLYGRIGDDISKKAYMKKACDAAVKGRMYSILAKYYMADSSLINDCISEYDEEHKNLLINIQKSVSKSWTLMYKSECGISQIPDLSIEQNEILFLLSENFSKKTIALVKNMSDEKLDEELNAIAGIIGSDSTDNLPSFGKKLFSSMEHS